MTLDAKLNVTYQWGMQVQRGLYPESTITSTLIDRYLPNRNPCVSASLTHHREIELIPVQRSLSVNPFTSPKSPESGVESTDTSNAAAINERPTARATPLDSQYLRFQEADSLNLVSRDTLDSPGLPDILWPVF